MNSLRKSAAVMLPPYRDSTVRCKTASHKSTCRIPEVGNWAVHLGSARRGNKKEEDDESGGEGRGKRARRGGGS
jgi:hypothetical protein